MYHSIINSHGNASNQFVLITHNNKFSCILNFIKMFDLIYILGFYRNITFMFTNFIIFLTTSYISKEKILSSLFSYHQMCLQYDMSRTITECIIERKNIGTNSQFIFLLIFYELSPVCHLVNVCLLHMCTFIYSFCPLFIIVSSRMNKLYFICMCSTCGL